MRIRIRIQLSKIMQIRVRNPGLPNIIFASWFLYIVFLWLPMLLFSNFHSENYIPIFVFDDDAAEACPVHGGAKKVSKQTGKSEKTPV